MVEFLKAYPREEIEMKKGIRDLELAGVLDRGDCVWAGVANQVGNPYDDGKPSRHRPER